MDVGRGKSEHQRHRKLKAGAASRALTHINDSIGIRKSFACCKSEDFCPYPAPNLSAYKVSLPGRNLAPVKIRVRHVNDGPGRSASNRLSREGGRGEGKLFSTLPKFRVKYPLWI